LQSHRAANRLIAQEPILFRGSVFDNIAHGLVGTKWESAARDEQMALVVEAAKTAYAHDFITELPNGYDTEIGQRGGLLSGGQKQRVAIARSVVSQPKVLLLDEATSALDPHAEGIVQQALDRAAEGRTTIVIAHKLATIKKAHNSRARTRTSWRGMACMRSSCACRTCSSQRRKRRAWKMRAMRTTRRGLPTAREMIRRL